MLALFLALLLLLAVPVTLKFQVAWPQTSGNDVEWGWAFGLVRVRSGASHAVPTTPVDDMPQLEDRHAEPSRPKSAAFVSVIRLHDFRRRIFRFVCDLWRLVHKKNVRLHIRLGLGDPADTGQLWIVAGPLAGLLATLQEPAISIEPQFGDAAFELDSAGTVRIIPLQFIYLSIALLLSPSIWRGVMQMRKVGG